MVNIKLRVCGFERKYTINHIYWKDLPTVSQRMVDMLEGRLGQFKRTDYYDEEYTIAYTSSLPEGTNQNAVKYALDHVVPCLLNPDVGIELAKQEDSSYAGCQWWHIKQNSYIVKQVFFSGLSGKPAWDLDAIRGERCPDCKCSWNDPRPNVLERLELDKNVFGYENSWYRYEDILEGRMDYIDGELITLQSNDNEIENQDDECDDIEDGVKDLITHYMNVDRNRDIERDDDLRHDLHATNFRRIQLYEAICRRYETPFPAEECYKSMRTVGDLVEFVRDHLPSDYGNDD